MDFGQAVVDFVSKNGIASAVLLFLAWFLTTRVWPWLVKEYWPALSQREDQRNLTMKILSDNLIELKINHQEMQRMIERNYDAARADSRVLIESIAALHYRIQGPQADAAAVERMINELRKAAEGTAKEAK